MKPVSPPGVLFLSNRWLEGAGRHKLPASPPLHLRSVQRCRTVHVGHAAPSSDVPRDGLSVSCFRSQRTEVPSCHAEHSRLRPAQPLLACLLCFGSSYDNPHCESPEINH